MCAYLFWLSSDIVSPSVMENSFTKQKGIEAVVDRWSALCVSASHSFRRGHWPHAVTGKMKLSCSSDVGSYEPFQLGTHFHPIHIKPIETSSSCSLRHYTAYSFQWEGHCSNFDPLVKSSSKPWTEDLAQGKRNDESKLRTFLTFCCKGNGLLFTFQVQVVSPQ